MEGTGGDFGQVPEWLLSGSHDAILLLSLTETRCSQTCGKIMENMKGRLPVSPIMLRMLRDCFKWATIHFLKQRLMGLITIWYWSAEYGDIYCNISIGANIDGFEVYLCVGDVLWVENRKKYCWCCVGGPKLLRDICIDFVGLSLSHYILSSYKTSTK